MLLSAISWHAGGVRLQEAQPEWQQLGRVGQCRHSLRESEQNLCSSGPFRGTPHCTRPFKFCLKNKRCRPVLSGIGQSGKGCPSKNQCLQKNYPLSRSYNMAKGWPLVATHSTNKLLKGRANIADLLLDDLLSREPEARGVCLQEGYRSQHERYHKEAIAAQVLLLRSGVPRTLAHFIQQT